jgi:hypothetical protein
MAIPNHSAESWQIWIVYEDDTAVIATPYELTLFGFEIVFTEHTISHEENVNENGT